jgi:hypothetical protein
MIMINAQPWLNRVATLALLIGCGACSKGIDDEGDTKNANASNNPASGPIFSDAGGINSGSDIVSVGSGTTQKGPDGQCHIIPNAEGCAGAPTTATRTRGMRRPIRMTARGLSACFHACLLRRVVGYGAIIFTNLESSRTNQPAQRPRHKPRLDSAGTPVASAGAPPALG